MPKLNTRDITQLDPRVIDLIAALRKEAAESRLARKKAQDYANHVTKEVEQLRAEVEALKAELGR